MNLCPPLHRTPHRPNLPPAPSAPTAQGRQIGPTLYADALLEVAEQGGCQALWAMAQASPALRAQLLQTGAVRRALLADNYAVRYLPVPEQPQARATALRLLHSERFLQQCAPQKGVGVVPLRPPGATRPPSQSFIGDSVVVLAYDEAPDRKLFALSMDTPKPTWRPFVLPRVRHIYGLSPEGKWLATADHDEHGGHVLRLFVLQAGQAVAEARHPYDAPLTLRFSGRQQQPWSLLVTPTVTDAVGLTVRTLPAGTNGVVGGWVTWHFDLLADDAVAYFKTSPAGTAMLLTSLHEVALFDPTLGFVDRWRPRGRERDSELFFSEDGTKLLALAHDQTQALVFCRRQSVDAPPPRRTAVAPGGRLVACAGDHLLATNPAAAESRWQRYDWTGTAVGAPWYGPRALATAQQVQFDGTWAIVAQPDEVPASGAAHLAGTSLAAATSHQWLVHFGLQRSEGCRLRAGYCFDLDLPRQSQHNWLLGRPLQPHAAAAHYCLQPLAFDRPAVVLGDLPAHDEVVVRQNHLLLLRHGAEVCAVAIR